MTLPLGARVRRIAVGGLLGALLAAGIGTAVLVHQRARQALDEALVAAALAESHPPPEARWTPHQTASEVEVGWWRAGDPQIPDDLARTALGEEVPRWVTADGTRLLLLAVEPAAHADDGTHHPHELIVARAPAVTWQNTVVPFLTAWALMAAAVAFTTSLVLQAALDRALAPLGHATAQLARLRALSRDVRLEVAGDSPEVDTLLRAVNTLLDRLDAAFSAQARFTSEAAHELRTPLTWMLGELELALRRPRTPEAYREALLAAQDAARGLHARVEDLMALARVDAGQIESGLEPEHVGVVLRAALHDEARTLSAAGCTVQTSLDDDAEGRLHAGLLRAAFSNVLRNVAAHAPGSAVRIHTRRQDDALEITVADHGPGVPPDQHDRVMHRHERGEGSRGLGLGLPLAREIVARHGGAVTLHDTPGGGLTVRIRLPV